MRRDFFCAFLILLSLVFSSWAQEKKTESSISSSEKLGDEPFRISKGMTFSASSPRQKRIPLSPEAQNINRELIKQDLTEALNLIRQNHVNGKKISTSQLTKFSISSMLRSLDPHSSFFDSVEYQELLSDQNSEYTGIGASIAGFSIGDKTDTFVTSTYQDSPAFRAGLSFGDKILAVDGENMNGKSSLYVREKIRGNKGTIVRVLVEKAETKRQSLLEIRRNVIPQPSIPDAYLLRPGIGYIALTEGFNYTTADEIEVALEELKKQGAVSFILDLRDNPGGILEQSVKVAQKFLNAGQVIVSQKGRFEIDNRVWKSNNPAPVNAPLVVLVNEGSASATEIVAGALQDYDRALIVGENTFGKGLVQSVINLPFGAGLTLTTAKYYTPSGRLIQRDYSNGNIYDYYRHKMTTGDKSTAVMSKTITGRPVYSGNGILPDEVVKEARLTNSQIELIDPLFFFTVELVNKRISGFENFQNPKPTKYGYRIQAGDLNFSEDVFNAFKKFVAKFKNLQLSPEKIEENRKFIAQRFRFNLATAFYGGVTATQVLVENDLQVAKAVESLPRAQNLALAARKVQKLSK